MKDIYNNNNNNKEVVDFIKNNYGRNICDHELSIIDEWLKINDKETIVKAVKISIENNVKKFSYVSSILNNWNNGKDKVEHNPLSKEDLEILNYDWLNDPENWFNWDK